MARVELREILTEGRSTRRAGAAARTGSGRVPGFDGGIVLRRPTSRPGRCRASGLSTAGDGGRLVGFTMISDGIPEPIDADLVGPYFLWKLLIDFDEQHNGYGAATIDAVVAYLRTRPGADTLFTSCTTGQARPAASTSATASRARAG